MERVCFLLQVKRERLAEYKERHRRVWPEMLAALSETGWRNYSLFLRDDGLLVGSLETDNFAEAVRRMASTEVNRRCASRKCVTWPQQWASPSAHRAAPVLDTACAALRSCRRCERRRCDWS